jgi:hypothetical protein
MLSVTLQPRSSQVPVENGADGVKVELTWFNLYHRIVAGVGFSFRSFEVAAALKGQVFL